MKNYLENNRKLNFFFYKLYHLIFSEKFTKKISYNFEINKSRLDLIKYCIKKNNYQSYLEIGCDKNQIFDHIILKDKIGVDPVSGGNFRGTSDNFFLKNKRNFDCIFIDGLHCYEQVLKDIENSLRFLNHNGVIILHDTLPDQISKQWVPRCRYSWNGDVWKAIVEVRTWINCNTFTSLIDQGVSIIKKEKNEHILDLKIKSFKNLSFKFFYENYPKLMRLKSYNETTRLL